MRFGSLCKKCRGEDLSAYIDGMLDGETMRRVASHLRACEDCRRVHDALSQTKLLLRTASAPSQPSDPDFWTNAYRRARLDSAATTPQPSARRGKSIIMRRAGIAAATAGVVLAALIFGGVPTNHSIVPSSSRQPVGPTLDVADLLRAHADYAAEQPLADNSRLSIILSDVTTPGVYVDDSLSADTGSFSDAIGTPSAKAAANAGGALD